VRRSQWMEGALVIGGCDKHMPADGDFIPDQQ
jgi:hypothetical protein